MPVFNAFRGGCQSYLDRKGESMNNKHTGSFYTNRNELILVEHPPRSVLLTPAHLQFFLFFVCPPRGDGIV